MCIRDRESDDNNVSDRYKEAIFQMEKVCEGCGSGDSPAINGGGSYGIGASDLCITHKCPTDCHCECCTEHTGTATGTTIAGENTGAMNSGIVDDADEFVAGNVTVIAGNTVTIDSGFTNILAVRVFNGTDDITNGLDIDVQSPDVILGGNTTLNNLIVKVIGNG